MALTKLASHISQRPEGPQLPFLSRDSCEILSRYEVNLIVDNSESESAPVIYEANPSYPNIIGKIEHRAEMGALVTDFRMIRSGALLQANGSPAIFFERPISGTIMVIAIILFALPVIKALKSRKTAASTESAS